MPATASIGIAKTINTEVTRVIQVNTGILNMLMPGARMFIIVTMKLSPAAFDATHRMFSPTTQEVIPRPGLKVTPELGAYPNHPPFGALPVIQPALMISVPNRNIQ